MADNEAQHLENALKHFKNKDFDKVIFEANQALKIDPKSDAAYIWLGEGLWRKRRFHEAVEAAQKAVQLHPDYAHYYVALGIYQMANKQWAEAEHSFRTSIHLNPQPYAPHAHLGEVLEHNRLWAEAEKELEIAWKIPPDAMIGKKAIAAFFIHLANVLVAQGKYSEAIKATKQALQFNPGLYRFRIVGLNILYIMNIAKKTFLARQ